MAHKKCWPRKVRVARLAVRGYIYRKTAGFYLSCRGMSAYFLVSFLEITEIFKF